MRLFSCLLLIIILSCSTSKNTTTTISNYCREQLLEEMILKFDLNLDTLNLCDFVMQAGEVHKIDAENLTNCEAPDMDLFIIDYIKLTGELFPHKKCDLLIFLEPKLLQTKQFKSKMLKSLKAEYESYKGTPNDYRCQKCKTILINGQSDFPYSIRERLNNLKVKDIEYIKDYDKPMNAVLFGEKGKLNGVIEIRSRTNN